LAAGSHAFLRVVAPGRKKKKKQKVRSPLLESKEDVLDWVSCPRLVKKQGRVVLRDER